MVSVGQKLLDVPFGDMIKEMAFAIAEGQTALDINSINVAQALAETELQPDSVVLYVEETVDENGNVTATEVITNDKPMSLLTYGLEPRFYEFTESIIEVKMTISMKREYSTERKYGREFKFTNESKIKGSYKSSGLAGFLFGKSKVSYENTTNVAYTSTYNATYKSKYTFNEEGSSLLRTTLKPVPAPDRAVPTIRVKEAPSP
ncbi:hypothetical protein V7O66_04885 [Methanolobus sp. ZRKC3]|uniref:hypothetical protein n=1 Tax=Methanolobus sp. ZRKC3 TaxID=3125786 RepID=UPI00324C2A22